jgi:hypothetical protein
LLPNGSLIRSTAFGGPYALPRLPWLRRVLHRIAVPIYQTDRRPSELLAGAWVRLGARVGTRVFARERAASVCQCVF